MNTQKIPFFGARKFAAQLQSDLEQLQSDLELTIKQRDQAHSQLKELGGLTILDLNERKRSLDSEIKERLERLSSIDQQLAVVAKQIVETEDAAILQEAGVYSYSHPLSDAVAYQSKLLVLQDQIKSMNRKDGGAVLAATSWTVNGSATEGRAMVRDFSKLLLRAFNAEADNLVRGLKPYKMQSAIDRLTKVSNTITKLGKTMHIQIAQKYFDLRIQELRLSADYLQKHAEEKEKERAERERLKEERKAQQELEREKARLDKERQHYLNALSALQAKGDTEGAQRISEQLADVERAIQDVDYRAANIRAGYVYVISNIGSFGDSIVKVGMTRRLDPMDRIRELSDASVPFNFDVHALFFSNDAVGIETAMHTRLAPQRCNLINLRREFFHATPSQAKEYLAELAGELLSFQDLAEAMEYRQTVDRRKKLFGATKCVES
jgi:hypothetical protein